MTKQRIYFKSVWQTKHISRILVSNIGAFTGSSFLYMQEFMQSLHILCPVAAHNGLPVITIARLAVLYPLLFTRFISDIFCSSGQRCSSTLSGDFLKVLSLLNGFFMHPPVIEVADTGIHSSSSTRITTYQSLRIQLVQNAPDDGPMRSETCRANLSAE